MQSLHLASYLILSALVKLSNTDRPTGRFCPVVAVEIRMYKREFYAYEICFFFTS